MFNRIVGCGVLLVCTAVVSGPALAGERCVVGEEFTATWCGPCVPVGNAMSAMLDQLGDNRFALLQVHISDNVTIPWGTARANQYGVTAIPTMVIDSTYKYVGSNLIAQMQAAINARMSIPTDTLINMTAQELSPSSFKVNGTVSLEATGTEKTVRIWVVQVLDYYPSGSHHRNCVRQVQGGVDVTLQPGGQYNFAYTFNLAAVDAQNLSRVKFIAFAQKPGPPYFPAEVDQGHVMTHPFPPSPIPGDLDGDGCVGQPDLGILLGNYGLTDGGDIDGDGVTGQADLGILLANYGQGCQ